MRDYILTRLLFKLTYWNAFLLGISGLSQAAIFETHFEEGSIPGGYRGTWNGGEFVDQWTLTPSLELEAGNRYARFTATMYDLPASSDTKWFGGYYSTVQSSLRSTLDLPDQWAVSFDYRTETLDPIMISIVQKFRSPTPAIVHVAWVTPDIIGWDNVVLDDNDFENLVGPQVYAEGFSIFNMSALVLKISLASHDSSGNPLAMTTGGVHALDIDNVTFAAIPEPADYSVAFSCVLLLYSCIWSRQKAASRC